MDTNLLKDRVSKGRQVRFVYYQARDLWYTCDDGFFFPVPIEETGDATFNKEDKAILFMKWIKSHMEFLRNAKELQKNNSACILPLTKV